MKLTTAQTEKLSWLYERGGSGYLDRYGRFIAGGDAGHPAWQQSWLNLVANGLLSGGDGRLTITKAGMNLVTPNASLTGGPALSARPVEAQVMHEKGEA